MNLFKCPYCQKFRSYPLGFNSANEYEFKCRNCLEIFINFRVLGEAN